MRSTSATMRSVSSQISWVSSRPAGSASCSSSCAAPRIPESGFLTSCASIAAIAVIERAALRCVKWRSIISAIERSCSVSTRRSAPSPVSAAWIVTERLPKRGPSSSMSYSEIVLPTFQTESTSDSTGCAAPSNRRFAAAERGGAGAEELFGRRIDETELSARSMTITGSARAARITDASGSPFAGAECRRPARRRPRSATPAAAP